jgi:molybdopterin/thiamine biosynthesis adenylyltransferase
MRYYIIGCGGVGSWLVPKLAKLVPTKDIILMDGDVLEEKNLDRQLFDPHCIGMNKAEALAERYGIPHAVPEYFSPGSIEPWAGDILFVCADNHAARRAALHTADALGCKVIVGANEYTDAEAYIYHRDWKDTGNDPRVFYPDILTDRSGDPLAPVGCTGEAAVASPQLVLANDWASGLMLHLFWYHTKEADKYPQDYWPVHEKVSFAKFTTIKFNERHTITTAETPA